MEAQKKVHRGQNELVGMKGLFQRAIIKPIPFSSPRFLFFIF